MKWQPDSKVLIQGIIEPLASHYAARMKAYGTNIVAGVSVGFGGHHQAEIPVFDLVEEAISQVGDIDISLIFLPPYEVLDAALEAIAAGIKQIIIVSSGVPPLDMVYLLKKAQTSSTFILGSGSHGVIVPDELWLGMSEASFYLPGKIGLISRCDSGTVLQADRLTDEIAHALTQAGFGQSIAVSLGTDGILGSSFEQWLQILEEDDNTEVIVLIGQPNGKAEMMAAEYIMAGIEKPVIAYIAGLKAPRERIFGDAATIIATQLSYGVPAPSNLQQILAIFKQANVKVAKRLTDIPKLVKEVIS